MQAIDWSLQYIYKNPDLDEDLYSCIIQELDNESLNVRLNIFYLIAQLCKTEKYRNWVAQDLPTILDKVVPETKVGYVNLGATRRVLTELDFMNDEIREWLNQREIDCKNAEDSELSKEEILRRMDDDRERSKQYKENIWAIDPKVDEFDLLWDKTTTGINSIDRLKMKEANNISKATLKEPSYMYP